MGAIIKKEWRSYKSRLLLYLAAAMLLLYCGVRFSQALFSSEISRIFDVFKEVGMVLVLFIPLLTMDSFTAEKHAGTDRLLFSAGVSVLGVVFAKFCAAFSVFAAFSLLALLLPMAMMVAAGAYIAEVLLLYCGVLCIGAAVMAMGIFLSSLSSHGIRALLVTVAVLIAWWMLDALQPYVRYGWIRQLFSLVSVLGRFDAFRYGMFSYAAVAYLGSVTLVLQAGTVQALQLWRRRRI